MKRFRIPCLGVLLLTMALCGASCSRTDEAKPAANAKPYPLDTCLVCGMKLSGMGEPFVFVHNGQEIRVCDQGEKAEFEKDPAKYLRKLETAPAPQM